MPTQNDVVRALKSVTFPGLDRDIVSLGYLKELREEQGKFRIRIELSTNLQGAGEEIEREVHAALAREGISYELDFEAHFQGPRPQAENHTIEPEEILPGVPFKIAVASGKGGVGKSTVAINLALGLARLGHRVGLLDSDVYGPSIPVMMGLEEVQPEVRDHKLVPLERYGVRSMSIGYLIDRDTPVIWRGPMVGKAIDQLMSDVDWTGTDVLVFDLPPGTGDIQISLSQKTRLSGAVIVTTPQDVALIDAGKGVAMFQKVNVPILGIVENMSGFVCPHCGGTTEIFRSGGGKRQAERLGVPLLGAIPIDPEVVVGGDDGTPILSRSPESPAGRAFLALASRVAAALGLAARA
jgi:ATP-binding protein involved in chromosome partitioning